ncbi:sulfate transporter family-domain-containing protein [Myxozyma melibiosi]|uniref:Sulfate transporter family-domain-containing protein n=1 Tax=Myxozyma melibiosi TaxID=54550 RepID=A0ABR1F1Y8_9ASCO
MTMVGSAPSLVPPIERPRPRRRSLASHAQTHLRLASITSSSPASIERDPSTVPAADLRGYTAEIASLALDDAFAPVPVPPLSSSGESTLTLLLRTANDHPLADSASTSSGSSSSSQPDPLSLHSDNTYNDDEPAEDQPLLNDLSRYGSEFAFSEPSETSSRPSLLSRISSASFLSRRRSSQYSRTVFFSRPRPFIKSASLYLRDHRSDLMLPFKYIPSVILGVLLNVLDGLSYGMILFPLGEPLFSSLGPEGLSMFYVSCIISQLVYSAGGSAFKGGVGSEMIEVVPFFHSMAYTLLARIGEDKPESVLATTVLAYAISSVVTGCVFFLLGFARIGSLIGFFPRHILVGCIGGVGWFLIATGLEVSSRMDGSMVYDLETLEFLFHPMTFLKWAVPLALAFILLALEHLIKHPLLVPTYFIVVFVGFHVLVSFIPGISLQALRDLGWVFVSPEASMPWYSFYGLYKFSAVDWPALFSTIPAMFALTFFGILHVPINVPALAVSVDEDKVDVDRELIAHGISNALSGLCGSIQNYLVYTNSLLFIRSGADSRIAGFMLAIATSGVMLAGPRVIGIIPVMVVGALIFLLGIELLREALYDTWGRVNRFEYFVIVAIIVSMGAWDFVYGIIIGIILACGSFVVESSRKSAIKATYSGTVARSTVRRHPFQQRFLKEVGDEIFVVKLSGFLFFGTIVSVESKIRDLLENPHNEQFRRIKYLVIDFKEVRGVDFSAAEAFTRMHRLLESRKIELTMCALSDDVSRGLQAVGLWENSDPDNDIHIFADLNSALEWSENQLLAVYYHVRDQQKLAAMHKNGKRFESTVTHSEMPIEGTTIIQMKANALISDNMFSMSSPRQTLVHRASSSAMLADPTFAYHISPDHVSHEGTAATSGSQSLLQTNEQEINQPLTLFLQIIADFSTQPSSFWAPVMTYFKREEHKAGSYLFHKDDDADGFYLVEKGILKAEYNLDQGKFYEAIVAGTTAGELPFFSETKRSASMMVERDAVVWRLTAESWLKFLNEANNDHEAANRRQVALELYKIAMKLTAERFSAITSYVLTSAG